MASLTAKQQSFIKLMAESEELSRYGFEMLVQRPGCEQLFDALSEAGLFAPDRNPGPVPAEEGYVRIPYWSPLDYLVAIASLSGERHDLVLADKVMSVVRAVSAWRDPEGRPRENHHTWRKFAQILGRVPTAAVTLQDAALANVWLTDRFDAEMVAHELDEGALRRLLGSAVPADWAKALELFGHCTAIRWQPAKELGGETTKPTSVVNDYWLKKLIENHATSLGTRIGAEAAALLRGRIREVFTDEGRRRFSRTYRPAIENHSQNHDWHGVENRPIDGLRDVVLAWCNVDPSAAGLFVAELLGDSLEILRRIAIYVISQRWGDLGGLYSTHLGPDLFSSGHLHELYNLLRERFGGFSAELKASTVRVIHELPTPDWGDDPARSLRRIQQRWLSAVVGKGSAPADNWFADLQAALGPLSEHPEFSSYSTSSSGLGQTPYSVQDLLVLADQDLLIDKLNAFQPKDAWRGPTIDALSSTLEEAAKSTPGSFLRVLPQFTCAKTDFQHSVIRGLHQAWAASGTSNADVDWVRGWGQMVDFFDAVIGSEPFWKEDPEERGHRPTRDWVVSDIADFIEAGTKNDEHAMPFALLPRTRSLIELLLSKTDGVDEPAEDAMMQAINASKGKVIEALFSQSLMMCRAGDRSNGAHATEWSTMTPLFEAELAKCETGNYEFSTLAGAYLPQLDYMDPVWTETRLARIFNPQRPLNEMCAIDGLAYASFTKRVYLLLRNNGVLDRALRYDFRSHTPREKVLERIATAYLWGDEELDGGRFAYLFASSRVDDLAAVARVFGSLRGDKVSDPQRNRVLAYWQRGIGVARSLPAMPAKFLSTLSTLAPFVSSAEGSDLALLESVAPYVHVGYNADAFIRELARLVEVSPDGVSAVLGKVLDAHVPVYDYQDRLATLLERLVEKGKKADVIAFAEKVRGLKGIPERFDRWTRGS